MENATQARCAECLESMARTKDELLMRIACANCQYAQAALAVPEKQLDRWPALAPFLRRCPECGKWRWSESSLAGHRRLHQAERN
jgi:ribosomal protein S27AE